MKGLLQEIEEIPERAAECYAKNKTISLPLNVPYLGMGSSYFAPLTLMYCAKAINPHIASEYYYYLSGAKKNTLGVLLSQSGESSETIWNIERFEKIVAIVNNPRSTLAKKASRTVELYAGNEAFSSTKSYINTLITLYLGLGINPKNAVEFITLEFDRLKEQANAASHRFLSYYTSHQTKGLYIIGSGPNIGTAYEGALTFSETTKLSWIGMPVAQYDHGPKETANDTVVVIVNGGGGHSAKRIEAVKTVIGKKSNACVIEFRQESIPETLTPLPLSVSLQFFMNFLADGLRVSDTFQLGGKVTKVADAVK